MKKLKIFLLLSILLCFGFMLSSEVHAQGNGPKAFEVDDVLPATTQLRISWVGDILIIVNGNSIRSNISLIEIPFSNSNIYIGRNIDDLNIVVYNSSTQEFTPPYTNYDGDHPYIDIDTSTWDIERRTITQVSSDMVGIFTWEDMNVDPDPTNAKIFEVGDELPANTLIRISWTQSLGWGTPQDLTSSYINGSGDSDSLEIVIQLDDGPILDFSIYTVDNSYYIVGSDGNFIPPYTDYGGGHAYCDIVLNSPVTITNVDFGMDLFTWEAIGNDIPQDDGPKIFEVGDVLPPGLVRLSWDETFWANMPAYFLSYHQVKSNNNSFNFIERIENNYYIGGINIAIVPKPGDFAFVPPYTVYGEGHAYVDIDTAGWSILKRTISHVYWDTNIDSRLYWEDITPDGYTQGYLEAREEFGYYDPNTNEWLSVTEYLNRYGTDKPGQSDFYGNFDKYFIPAMIIVFGGAIVLTILKVFKGRE